MPGSELDLMPYLTFYGNCEEAFSFYKDILGATLHIVSRYDNPAMNAPEAYRNKVLHANLQFGSHIIFGSDAMPGKEQPVTQSNIALSLHAKNEEEGKRIFDKLAEGGKVHVPFKKQFWGDHHGNLTDRFGIHWMMNCSG